MLCENIMFGRKSLRQCSSTAHGRVKALVDFRNGAFFSVIVVFVNACVCKCIFRLVGLTLVRALARTR